MKAVRFFWLSLVALALFAVACNPAPQITGATLGTNVQSGKIQDAKTTFAPADHMIHVVVDVQDVTSGANVGVKWYSVDGGEHLLFESESALDPFNTSADFALTASNDWQPGSYQVVIFLNGKEDRRLNFQVK